MMHNWRPTERLDSVLDRSVDRLDEEDPEAILRDYPQSRNTLAPMLHIADALRDLEQVTMRPDAKQAGRERLRKAVLARQRRRPRSALKNTLRMAAWVAAFVLVCTGAISGLNRASADTLPDQPLYAWKRVTERVWLGMQFTPEREIAVSLALADRRVDEVKRLYQRSGRVDPAIITQLQADYKRTLQLIDTLPPSKAQPLLAQAQAIGAEHEQELTRLAQQATGDEQQILLAAVEVSQWVQHTPPEQATSSPPPVIPDETSVAPTTRPAVPSTTTAPAVPGGRPQPTSPVAPPASDQPPANNPSDQPGGPTIGIPSTPNPTAVPVPPAQKPSAVPQPSKPSRPAPTERANPPRPTAKPQPTQAPPTAVPATDTPPEPGPPSNPPGNPTAQPGPTIEPPGPPTAQPGPPSNPPGNPTVQPGPPSDPPGQNKTPKPTDPPKEEKTPRPTNQPGPPSNPPGNPTVQPGPPSDPPGNGQPGPPSNPPGNPTAQPGPPNDPPGQSKTPKPTNPPKKEEEPPSPTDPPKEQP